MPSDVLPADQRRRILLTGAAGAIGRAIAPALQQRGHHVRGFDRAPMPHLDDAIVADLTDRGAIDRATDGVDTIIHLAAYPNPADFIDTLLEPNVVGLYHITESAIVAGVGRLILASSVQAMSGHQGEGPAGVDVRKPTNYYALTKTWAEDLGEMTARLHGIEVIAARIGWFPRGGKEVNHLARRSRSQPSYLSHDDAARFFTCAVEAELTGPPPHYHTVYAVGPGANGQVLYDTQPAAQALGYRPQDTFPRGMPFEVEERADGRS